MHNRSTKFHCKKLHSYRQIKLGIETLRSIASAESMSETQESNGSFWKGLKDYFGESFYLNDYTKILHPEKPLPHWDSSVVEEFIASDPVHGPTLKNAREAAKFGLVGAGVGAVLTGGNAWRWSKSPHGAVLSFAFGGVVGFTLGAEVANHWYQLSTRNSLEAQAKFFDWLQKRA